MEVRWIPGGVEQSEGHVPIDGGFKTLVVRILNQFQGVGLTSCIVIITWRQALGDLQVKLFDQSFDIG